MPKYGEFHLFSCPVCCERHWVPFHPQRKYHDRKCAKRAEKRLAAGEPLADKVWYHRNAWGEEFELTKPAPKKAEVPPWYDAEAYRREIRKIAAESNEGL